MTRILVAEDDIDLRQIIHDLLTASGFEILLAADGLEALSMVKKEKPDLLVLDLAMPEVDGWQVAEDLRKSPSTRNLPILALTARARWLCSKLRRDRPPRSGRSLRYVPGLPASRSRFPRTTAHPLS